jgi:Flp pilus assembly protein TadD
MPLSKKDQHHLQASVGYTRLGMDTEALEEIGQISHPERNSIEVLSLELAILHQCNHWKEAMLLAGKMLELDPENPDWHIASAYATRRALSLAEARVILSRALQLFPANALIHYNLGCYAAQLGELQVSCRLIEQAFRLDSKFKKVSRTDPDLEPIRHLLKKPALSKKE